MSAHFTHRMMQSFYNYESSLVQRALVIAVCIFVFAFTFWPLFYFFQNGVFLGHLYEESIGYRYFFSLRAAEGGEYPWIPQGQLQNIVFVGIQHALSAAGLPVNDLISRPKVFTYLGALPPMILTMAAGYFIVRSARDWTTVLLAFLPACLVHLTDTGTVWLSIPEYVGWTLPIALFTVLACLILILHPSLTKLKRVAVFLGIFFGLVASTKITFSAFSMIVALTYIHQSNVSWRTLQNLGLIALTTTISYLAVIFIAQGASVGSLFVYFENLRIFSESQSDTLGRAVTGSEWRHILIPQSWTGVQVFGAIFFCIYIYLVWQSRRKLILCLFIVPAICTIAFYQIRPYHVTFIETMSVLASLVSVFSIFLIEGNQENRNYRPQKVVFSALSVFFLASSIAHFFGSFPSREYQLEVHQDLSSVYEEVNAYVDQIDGRVGLVALDNRYRLPLFFSGICKGGSDIFNMSWRAELYVAKMLPKIQCLYFVKQPPGASENLDLLILMSHHNISMDGEAYISKVEEFFELEMGDFNCSRTRQLVVSSKVTFCFHRDQR